MSLSTRIALTLSLVLLVGALVGSSVYARVFEAYFGGVERAVALDAAAKVKQVLADELDDLARAGARVAHNDRLHHAAPRRSQSVDLGGLLDPNVLHATGLDLVFVTDLGGRVVRSHLRHPDRPRGTTLRAFPRESINLPQLLGHDVTVDGLRDDRSALTTGVIRSELGPLLLVARNLVPASREEPRTGVVLVGRFLGEALDAEIESQLGFAVDVWPVGTPEVPRELRGLQDEVTSSAAPVLRELDAETLEVLTTVDDIQRRPEFLVRATLPRDIAAAGAVARQSGVLMSITLALVLLLVLIGFLRALVLRPLERLTAAVVHTGEHEDYGVRVGGDREDEIGALGREFDRMLERLQEARSQVIGTARSAGMSEIAQEILHSAGTVLTHVRTSTGVLRERLQDMPVDDLLRVSAALEAHRDDLPRFVAEDPRGRHLQPFLAAFASRMADDHAELTAELETLDGGIARVCDLVESQGGHAGESRVLERIRVDRIVEDVAAVASVSAQASGATFHAVVEDGLPTIVTDRRRVVEALLHLAQNACESIERSGPRLAGHRLTVRASLQLGGRIRFDVVDTGEGIDGVDRDRLFEFGYTTHDGGSGLGLHNAANSAKLLGGDIQVASRGLGEGATFALVIPVDASSADGRAAGGDVARDAA